MSKELIERLRIVGGVGDEAADALEAQQSWIASLEQNARDADRMYKELETELAASQQREKVLRGYLFAAYGMATESPENQPFDWAVFCELLHKALNQPTDTTALDEMLKAERERCAIECEDHAALGASATFCAEAIRAMEDQ